VLLAACRICHTGGPNLRRHPCGLRGNALTDVDEVRWWRRTKWLATVVLAGHAFGMSLALLLATPLNGGTLFNLPFGYFVVAMVSPVILMLAIFWFADRQRSLDHQYDVIDG
jgi:putative solute:sodium symporter small subunit